LTASERGGKKQKKKTKSFSFPIALPEEEKRIVPLKTTLFFLKKHEIVLF
jgi:hypothetical protein